MNLTCHDNLGVRRKLKLCSNRIIFLESLEQSTTYVGLLTGSPDKSFNDVIINEAISKAKKNYPKKANVHLIKPKRCKNLNIDKSIPTQILGNAKLEWLPLIQCSGVFKSSAIDNAKDGSLLKIVWYQDDFALPIQKEIIKKISELKWESLATDFDY